MTDSAWFWLLLALAVFWSVGAYRRLAALRAQVHKQFSALEEMLLRYQALVQDATTTAVTSPGSWQSAIAPELGASHWTRLQVAANLMAMAIAHMQEHPLTPSSSVALVATRRDLQAAWESLTHPDVYYVSVPQELTQRWTELGFAVQSEVQRFNQAVLAYNAAIDQFPASLLARWLKYFPGRPLE